MPSQNRETNGDLLDNRFFRLLLFIVPFIMAPFLVFEEGVSFSDFPLILLFPVGWIAVFFRNADVFSTWSIAVGWILYVATSLIAVLVKKRSLFVVLYIFFLLLLFTNVAGCNLIVESIRF